MQGLPAAWYHDATRAALEYSRIFAGSWQFVCHVSDLPAPGTAARFDCAGRSAVVLRTRAGDFHGFRNVCRHRGARLIEGDLHTGLAFCVDGRLRCPYHGWSYDETGALADIPDSQQFDAFDAAAHALHRVEVAQWHGLVFIAFEPPSQPLARVLEPVAANWPDLSAMRRAMELRETACSADWKLACEHVLDVSHFGVARPVLKPRLFEPAAYKRRDGDALHATVELAIDSRDTWSARAYQHLLRDLQPSAAAAECVFLWPNLLLLLAPDGLSVLQVLPGATGQCTYRESRYGMPDPRPEMKLLRYLHGRVRRQARAADLRLLERVQQSLASLTADGTGPIAENEVGLRWFAEAYLARNPAPAARPHQ